MLRDLHRSEHISTRLGFPVGLFLFIIVLCILKKIGLLISWLAAKNPTPTPLWTKIPPPGWKLGLWTPVSTVFVTFFIPDVFKSCEKSPCKIRTSLCLILSKMLTCLPLLSGSSRQEGLYYLQYRVVLSFLCFICCQYCIYHIRL